MEQKLFQLMHLLGLSQVMTLS